MFESAKTSATTTSTTTAIGDHEILEWELEAILKEGVPEAEYYAGSYEADETSVYYPYDSYDYENEVYSIADANGGAEVRGLHLEVQGMVSIILPHFCH